MGGHERPRRGAKDEWLTPRWLLDRLGPFDLDPCSPVVRPWKTAKRHYTVNDDGLSKRWMGRVYCNPPYSDVGAWLSKLADHGDGIALVFSRTCTVWWHAQVFGRASSILFLKGRLNFHHVDGSPAKNDAGAASALVAYGWPNASALEEADLDGCHILLRGSAA